MDSEEIGELLFLQNFKIWHYFQYDWSHRAKTRQIAAHVDKALQSDRKDTDFCDPRLKSLMVNIGFQNFFIDNFQTQTWKDMFTNYDSLEPRRQKQAVALWEIFHTEIKELKSVGPG